MQNVYKYWRFDVFAQLEKISIHSIHCIFSLAIINSHKENKHRKNVFIFAFYLFYRNVEEKMISLSLCAIWLAFVLARLLIR